MDTEGWEVVFRHIKRLVDYHKEHNRVQPDEDLEHDYKIPNRLAPSQL